MYENSKVPERLILSYFIASVYLIFNFYLDFFFFFLPFLNDTVQVRY